MRRSSTSRWSLALLLLLLLLLLGLLALSLAHATGPGGDDDAQKKPPTTTTTTTTVLLTTASGEQREVSLDEFEAMQRHSRELQERIKRENAAAKRAGADGDGGSSSGDWVRGQRLEDLAASNPELARQLEVAATTFAELQRHGYARGYRLAGLTELDTTPLDDADTDASAGTHHRREYRLRLELRAEIDHASGVRPNAGTSATKRTEEPPTLTYELEILVDRDAVASIVRAWQLTTRGTRGRELSIRPSDALLARRQRRRGTSPLGAYSTWLLAAGATLMAVGAAVVLLSSRDVPPVASKAKDDAAGANVQSKKNKATPQTTHKTSREAVTAREAGEGWELAN